MLQRILDWARAVSSTLFRRQATVCGIGGGGRMDELMGEVRGDIEAHLSIQLSLRVVDTVAKDSNHIAPPEFANRCSALFSYPPRFCLGRRPHSFSSYISPFSQLRRRTSSTSTSTMTKGTNSQGNNYSTPGGTNSNGGSSYHYSNSNGSYYYSNDNGSTYYNSGKGSATYTSSSGQSKSYSTSK
jgi:hypothetical protein